MRMRLIDYEQLGIAPDIEITGDADMLDRGKDNILEGALEYQYVSNPYGWKICSRNRLDSSSKTFMPRVLLPL